MLIGSVVVYDFDILHPVVGPDEAESKLVVDADGVLAVPITPERLEPIAGGNAEVSQVPGEVQLLELTEGDFLDAGGQFRRLVTLVDLFGGGAPERNDHLSRRLRGALLTSSVTLRGVRAARG